MKIAAFLKDSLAEMWKKRVAMVITFASCVLVGQLSVFLYQYIGTSPSIIISPVGIALAAFVLEGYAMWPAVALAAAVNGFLVEAPLLLIASSVLGNTIQAVVGMFVLNRSHFDRLFLTLQHMFAMIFTALFTTLIVPTVSLWTILLYNALYDADRPVYLFNWWLGGALSTLVITPLLIRWLKRPLSPRPPAQYAEIVGSITLVVTSSIFLFGTPYTSFLGISFLYPLLAGLFWMAFRGGVRFMTLTLFLMTVISLAGAVWGTHTPSTITLTERITNTQTLDLFLVLFFFVLVLLEKQRANATRRLADHAAKLQEALARIRAEDEAKNEFIALLGHELRNPLAALLSSVEVLALPNLEEAERKEFLGAMNERIRAMAHLLDDILDISRITQRKFTLRKELLNAADIAKRASTAVTPAMEKHQHSFIVEFPNQELMVNADPTRLEQIMVNILHNAAKYTPPGGRIEFRGHLDGEAVVLRFKDTGVGIPKAMVERIFEPFVQVNPKFNRSGGLGIGLSLTKGLVDLHEGTLTVTSEEGKGSEFIVRLPRAHSHHTPKYHERDHKLNRIVAVSDLKILIVDDNQEAAQGLARLLTLQGGHETIVTYEGSSVLDAVAVNDPDVIILDIGLPDMDGYTVARMLRDAGVNRTLIALSGYGQAEDKRKAKNAGFDYHLTKPVGFKEIEALLERIAQNIQDANLD